MQPLAPCLPFLFYLLTWSGEQLRDGCGCTGGSGERAERDDRGERGENKGEEAGIPVENFSRTLKDLK
uniref:Uncharacterized protein n=1 Tax=Vespula pensylvanica TaxID=30213 RepID=A0A834N4W4_VESPE|nr:hypothetical protein H0235_017023 [Vespula pensylvanica]